MKAKKHRITKGRRVISAAIVIVAVSLNVNGMALTTEAISVKSAYKGFYEIRTTTVVDISWDEYKDLLKMTMAESGYCSYEMMNGCASTAINQCKKNKCSMHETLYRPGAYGNGEFKFRDENGEWRPVELEDVNTTVVKAVNDALSGEDVTEGAIGFFAPNYCSKETVEYFYEHISGTIQIENVVFFREWK